MFWSPHGPRIGTGPTRPTPHRPIAIASDSALSWRNSADSGQIGANFSRIRPNVGAVGPSSMRSGQAAARTISTGAGPTWLNVGLSRICTAAGTFHFAQLGDQDWTRGPRGHLLRPTPAFNSGGQLWPSTPTFNSGGQPDFVMNDWRLARSPDLDLGETWSCVRAWRDETAPAPPDEQNLRCCRVDRRGWPPIDRQS